MVYTLLTPAWTYAGGYASGIRERDTRAGYASGIRERGANVPIIVATGQARSQDRDAALTAGATAYLIKPFDPALLVTTVAQQVGHGQATWRTYPLANALSSPRGRHGLACGC